MRYLSDKLFNFITEINNKVLISIMTYVLSNDENPMSAIADSTTETLSIHNFRVTSVELLAPSMSNTFKY